MQTLNRIEGRLKDIKAKRDKIEAKKTPQTNPKDKKSGEKKSEKLEVISNSEKNITEKATRKTRGRKSNKQAPTLKFGTSKADNTSLHLNSNKSPELSGKQPEIPVEEPKNETSLHKQANPKPYDAKSLAHIWEIDYEKEGFDRRAASIEKFKRRA